MKKLLFLASVVFLAASPSMAAAKHHHPVTKANPQCVRTDKAQIATLFDRWNNSLRTGDARKVAANYARDSVLLPTMSNRVRKTDGERIDYFEHFLKEHPVGHIDSRTIRVGCNDAIDTGVYTFTFADGKKVQARYTFTYVWDHKRWLISSHHSSLMPEK
ncbi:SgcJ/EcaC family oxidoreductase [Ochrobactrum chromiisoli]|uniref:SgcJ/EcaC family oxidoreductase n=1 Tax=Ochrobactrum chromiisoli TaxID=2993941 RepID=A0ABT3QN56_9HYPH|nr:SgcJ/EcaC family oxidoreductase [Ochrobactrum chromiisoli]MCX2697026.1 SgcJ/EcaC family oxidoreductase [Ochrobactrum chromiisoli]